MPLLVCGLLRLWGLLVVLLVLLVLLLLLRRLLVLLRMGTWLPPPFPLAWFFQAKKVVIRENVPHVTPRLGPHEGRRDRLTG